MKASMVMVGQKPTLTNEKQGVNIAHQKVLNAQWNIQCIYSLLLKKSIKSG